MNKQNFLWAWFGLNVGFWLTVLIPKDPESKLYTFEGFEKGVFVCCIDSNKLWYGRIVNDSTGRAYGPELLNGVRKLEFLNKIKDE